MKNGKSFIHYMYALRLDPFHKWLSIKNWYLLYAFNLTVNLLALRTVIDSHYLSDIKEVFMLHIILCFCQLLVKNIPVFSHECCTLIFKCAVVNEMVAASLPFQSVCEEDLDTDLSCHVHVVDFC